MGGHEILKVVYIEDDGTELIVIFLLNVALHMCVHLVFVGWGGVCDLTHTGLFPHQKCAAKNCRG